MTPSDLTTALKEESLRLGFTLAGATRPFPPPHMDAFRRWVADGLAGPLHYLTDHAQAYEDPNLVLDGVRGILMLAMNYRSVEPKAVQAGEGCVSRYAWGIDYHEVIRPRLHRLADFHRRLVPNACVRGVVDTAPLLERGFAHQAGLGWIGKNTTLIHPTYGSWLFLAALLTSEELVFDVPMEGDPCSTCRACLDACPSGALQAPYRLDARRCISCLTIELRGEIPPDGRKALGNRVFGCDACQEACPWNQQGATAAEQAFYPQPGMNPVVLDELAAMDESEFRRRFGHSPLKRAGCAGIRRNIAAVSENQSRNHQ